MTVKSFAGAADILIDLEYSSDVALRNGIDDADLAISGGTESTLSNGVRYREYEINEDLNLVTNIYSNWAQLDVGDHVIIDPEFQFIAGASGDQLVTLMEGDRFYLVYPFDVESNPAETRAVSQKARRLRIESFSSGSTTLREYEPKDAMATGSIRVLLDTYWQLPAEKQFQEANLSVRKENTPLNTLISSEATEYEKSGIEVSLEISIASLEMEALSYIFGVFPQEDNSGRKRINLRDGGSLNAGNLNPRKVILKPQPEPSITAPNYREWLNSVVTIPQAVTTDPNQNLTYDPSQQRSYRVSFTAIPDENGSRIIFGNEGL